jgi:hypothetical protein
MADVAWAVMLGLCIISGVIYEGFKRWLEHQAATTRLATLENEVQQLKRQVESLQTIATGSPVPDFSQIPPVSQKLTGI